MRLMVQIRSAAMISGALAVRCWRSSSKTISSTQQGDSRSPVVVDPSGELFGLFLRHGQGADQVDNLDVLPAFGWAGVPDLGNCREAHSSGASIALTVRRTRCPWKRSAREMAGTFFQSRSFKVRRMGFWFALTTRR